MPNHPETVPYTRYRRELDDAQSTLLAAKAEARMWEDLTWRRINELGAKFGSVTIRSDGKDIETSIVVGLVAALWALDDADGALRGAPSEDTMRVGHGSMVVDGESVPVTGVERAALNAGRLRWLRKKVTQQLDGTIKMIYNELEGKPAKSRGTGRQCKRRECEQRNGKRQHTPRCGYCGESLEEEEGAA